MLKKKQHPKFSRIAETGYNLNKLYWCDVMEGKNNANKASRWANLHKEMMKKNIRNESECWSQSLEASLYKRLDFYPLVSEFLWSA